MTQHSGDLQTLAALKRHGADLSKSTEVNFYLYVASEDLAREAAEALRPAGYLTEVRPPLPGYREWLCFATRHLVPSAEGIADARATFEGLAARLGGEFDGWEAAVTS